MLLKTYSGERLKVVGEIEVNVEYENQSAKLILAVVAGEELAPIDKVELAGN